MNPAIDGRSPGIRASSAISALLLAAAFALPAPVTAQAPGSLSGLAFMSGCWRGDLSGGAAIEEFYTAPSDNVMLGLSRFMRDGRTVQHEFSRITADSTGVTLLPFPGGSPSEHGFRMTHLEDGRAIFEAPEHDFPKRIIYRRNPDGSNTARIEGGGRIGTGAGGRAPAIDQVDSLPPSGGRPGGARGGRRPARGGAQALRGSVLRVSRDR